MKDGYEECLANDVAFNPASGSDSQKRLKWVSLPFVMVITRALSSAAWAQWRLSEAAWATATGHCRLYRNAENPEACKTTTNRIRHQSILIHWVAVRITIPVGALSNLASRNCVYSFFLSALFSSPPVKIRAERFGEIIAEISQHQHFCVSSHTSHERGAQDMKGCLSFRLCAKGYHFFYLFFLNTQTSKGHSTLSPLQTPIRNLKTAFATYRARRKALFSKPRRLPPSPTPSHHPLLLSNFFISRYKERTGGLGGWVGEGPWWVEGWGSAYGYWFGFCARVWANSLPPPLCPLKAAHPSRGSALNGLTRQ